MRPFVLTVLFAVLSTAVAAQPASADRSATELKALEAVVSSCMAYLDGSPPAILLNTARGRGFVVERQDPVAGYVLRYDASPELWPAESVTVSFRPKPAGIGKLCVVEVYNGSVEPARALAGLKRWAPKAAGGPLTVTLDRETASDKEGPYVASILDRADRSLTIVERPQPEMRYDKSSARVVLMLILQSKP
jgi:hypothetical protein